MTSFSQHSMTSSRVHSGTNSLPGIGKNNEGINGTVARIVLALGFQLKYTEKIKMEKQAKRIHLFNCDKTFDLDLVELLFTAMKGKLEFDLSIKKHYFNLSKMSEMSNSTIPGLKMDFAVFVVHAHESRLSINEVNAGIGYAKIYRALLQATGE